MNPAMAGFVETHEFTAPSGTVWPERAGPPPAPGEHFWIVGVAYKVNTAGWGESGPPAGLFLDQENLIVTTPVACMFCRQAWSLATQYSPCTPPMIIRLQPVPDPPPAG